MQNKHIFLLMHFKNIFSRLNELKNMAKKKHPKSIDAKKINLTGNKKFFLQKRVEDCQKIWQN